MTGLVAVKLIERPRAPQTSTATLLQPNISQEMRWDDANLVRIFQRMMAMTDDAFAHGARVVIWPESTVPLSYARTDFFRDAVESATRGRGADIILGSVAEDPSDATKMWNAAFLVSDGKTIGHYDKIRLVPFGEYVPLRKMLFFAHKLVRAVGEFEFGTKDDPLNGTAAPRQHLNQARLRAVETDRYLLRAATTGISATVTPAGRIVEELAMNRQGTIYARFEPRATVTPYVRFGDWFAWCAIVGTVVGIRPRKLRTQNANAE
jgi:apolipoprotein N-acyltransferase